MASSDLLLKTLLAGQNPELAAAMPRMDMAQALMSQGMSAAPAASPWEGISRVGQALLGGYLYNQGQNDLQGVVGRRQKETEAGLSALSGASPNPAPPPSMTGGSPPPSNAFEPQLAAAEAPNPGTVNASGHSGQYQFSTGRLADLGAYTPAPGENLKANEWKGTFNVPGFANVRSQADFLGNPQAQKAVFGTHIADVDRAIDQTPNGASLSRDGLRAVAHLGGTEGMRKFVETGGQYNPADANGTKLSDYYQRFAGSGASPASAPVAPQYSPVTQQAMDTIKRANQVMSLPQFQNNAAVQDAAKRSIEFAKTLMEQDRHTRTETQSSHQFNVGQANTDRRQNQTIGAEWDRQTRSLGQAKTLADRGPIPTAMKLGPDEVLRPMDGAPLSVNPLETQQFTQADKLRDEHSKLTANFRTVQDSYENIRSAATTNNGAGDLSLLYGYMKMLDPGSVVRESEFATAAAAGSFGERIQGAVQRVISGERLPSSLRDSFVKEAGNIYANQQRSHDTISDQYRTLAKHFKLDPDTVVVPYTRDQVERPTAPPGVPVPTPKEATAAEPQRAPDGNYYIPDPARPGKYLQVK